MKRIINYRLIALLLGLAFVSCSENFIEETPELGNEETSGISFSVEVEADFSVSKGTPISASTSIPSVGVYSYFYDGSAHLTNEIGSYNSFYTDHYWPNNESLTGNDQLIKFYAYSPYADEATNGVSIVSADTNSLVIDYTVPTTIENQPDLMISAPQSIYEAVIPFTMEHALAAITFTFSGDDPNGYLTKVTTNNVINSCRVTMSSDGEMSWVNGTTDDDYTIALSATGSGLVSTSQREIVDGDGRLMMVPQILGTGATLYVESKYSTDYNYPQGYTVEDKQTTFDISGHEWSNGVWRYYNLYLEDTLPFIVIDDNTTVEMVEAKAAKLIADGYTDELVVVGGYGDPEFYGLADDGSSMANSTFEALINVAIDYYDDNSNNFSAIDLSEVVMYGDEEANNHLSTITFDFDGENEITTVTLPASLVKIYKETFMGYSGLTTVIMPEGCDLIDIPIDAFNGCTSLEMITFPVSARWLREGCFNGCTSLKYLYIPGAEIIGLDLFTDCPLEQLWLATDTEIISIDGDAFNGFDTEDCILFTNADNVSAGTSGSYNSLDESTSGGEISITTNGNNTNQTATVTLTETSSTQYTFDAVVFVEPNGDGSYTITGVYGYSNVYSTGDIIYPPGTDGFIY